MAQVLKRVGQWLWGDSSESKEQALLKKVLEELEKKKQIPRNRDSVLGVIDTCAEGITLPRHLGKELRSILATEVEKKKDPIVALELGTLCGCSAIIIASAIKESAGKLCCLDTNMQTTGDVKEILDYAGISAEVRVLDETSKTSKISSDVTLIKGRLMDVPAKLKELLNIMEAQYFDFIFMNHSIKDYGPDIGLLIERGLAGEGTVIVANTKEFPAAQDILKHIPKGSKIRLETTVHPNGMTVSTMTAPTIL